MAVKCFKVAQKNLQKPTDPVKHYLRNKSTGEMTERDLVEKGASISLMNPVDIKAANELFLQLIPEALSDGKIIRIGDFGTFMLKISSEGVENPDELTIRNIKGVKVIFRPGQAFKKMLRDIKFELE